MLGTQAFAIPVQQPGRSFEVENSHPVMVAFLKFLEEESLLEVVKVYQNLRELCEQYGKGCSTFETCKKFSLHHHRCKRELWDVLDARKSQPEYQSQCCSERRILVVGAGVAGLRTAIESTLMGAEVTVVEKRAYLSRHNVLRLWPAIVEDLRSLGAKFFYNRFCAGGLHHIGIWRLQNLLVKISLLLGVRIVIGASYSGIDWEQSMQSATCWYAKTPELEGFAFDTLVAADGERSVVTEEFQFEKTFFGAKRAIGVTCNFINHKGDNDAKIQEFERGSSYAKNLPFFQNLRDLGCQLENLVYYRDETHYLVFTGDKFNLLERGVLKSDLPSMQELLASENIDTSALQLYVKTVADFSGIPCKEFALNHWGNPDVQMFDFTKKLATKDFMEIVVAPNHSPLVVFAVGDAKEGPFWPKGTGGNKACLSAMDAVFQMIQIESISKSTNMLEWSEFGLRLNEYANVISFSKCEAMEMLPVELKSLLETANLVGTVLKDCGSDHCYAKKGPRKFSSAAPSGMHVSPFERYAKIQTYQPKSTSNDMKTYISLLQSKN